MVFFFFLPLQFHALESLVTFFKIKFQQLFFKFSLFKRIQFFFKNFVAKMQKIAPQKKHWFQEHMVRLFFKVFNLMNKNKIFTIKYIQ
jgi:hypothetical protein